MTKIRLQGIIAVMAIYKINFLILYLFQTKLLQFLFKQIMSNNSVFLKFYLKFVQNLICTLIIFKDKN